MLIVQSGTYLEDIPTKTITKSFTRIRYHKSIPFPNRNHTTTEKPTIFLKMTKLLENNHLQPNKWYRITKSIKFQKDSSNR